MQVLDFIVRIVFLPVLLFVLVRKAVPAMVKDIAGMVKELYGPVIRSLKSRLKSAKRRTQGAKRPVMVPDPVFIGIRNTIH